MTLYIPHIIHLLTGLEKTFDDYLFGQHLARDTVLGAIYGHVTNPNPKKALVLSLHGPPGTGKNHISHLVAHSLYTYGMKSSFVTEKMSTKDYPHASMLDQYKVPNYISSNSGELGVVLSFYLPHKNHKTDFILSSSDLFKYGGPFTSSLILLLALENLYIAHD